MASTPDPAPDHGTPWWHEGSGPEPHRHDDHRDDSHRDDSRHEDMAAAAADAATQAARAADSLLRQARVVGWQETLAGGLGLLGAFMRAAAERELADDAADDAADDDLDVVDVEIVEVEVEVVETVVDEGAEGDDGEGDTVVDDTAVDDADDDTAVDDAGTAAPAGTRWVDAGLPPQLAPWLDVGAGLLAESLGGARDHVRTGECRSCPVCRGLAVLRETNPDVVDGIGDALDVLVAMLVADDAEPH